MNQNRGFLRTIIILLIAFLIISYFGFNLREISNSPTAQSNWEFIKEVTGKAIRAIIKPIERIWRDLFATSFVQPLAQGIKDFQDGSYLDQIQQYEVVPR